MARELYNNGSAVRTQPGSAARAGASGRGVTIDSAALLGAVDVAMLDPSGAQAEGRGYAALGQGVANVGDAFSKIAEVQARQWNVKMVNKADSIMAAGNYELAEELAREENEMWWPELSQKKAAEVQSRLSELDLSPDARDEVESRYSSWNTRLSGETRVNSARKTHNDVKRDVQAGIDLDVQNEDKDSAYSKVDILKQSGALGDNEAELQKKAIDEGIQNVQKAKRADQLDANKNHAITMARTFEPSKVIEMIDNGVFEAATPEEQEYLKGVVRTTANNSSADLSAVIADGVSDGTIWNEAALDDFILKSGAKNVVTPRVRQSMLDEMNKYKTADARAKAKAVREGPEGYLSFRKLYMLAEDWNPERGTEEAATEFMELMMATKATVPTGYVGAITDILRGKFGAADGSSSDKRPEIDKMVSSRIQETFAADMVEVKAVRDKEKADLEKSPDNESRKKAYQAAQRAYKEKSDSVAVEQARIERMMSEWRSKNKDKDESAVLQYYNSLLTPSKAIMDAEYLGGAGSMDKVQKAVDLKNADEAKKKSFKTRLKETMSGVVPGAFEEPALPDDTTYGSGDPSGAVGDMPNTPARREPASPLLDSFYQPPTNE